MRSRDARLLAVAGVVALVLFTIALVPARVAMGLLGLPPGAATGLSGTLWSGTAEHLTVGTVAIGPVRWSARPGHLLQGQLAAAVEATLPDGFINGTVGFGLGSTIVANDLEAALPLALLSPAAGANGGQVAARFDSLALKGGKVGRAIGTLKVSGVVLPLPSAGRPPGPGTYEVTFDAADVAPDQPLTGTVKDAGGPLAIQGTVQFTPPRSYQLDGTAKARPDAPPELAQALQMLGPAAPDGGHTLSLAGSF